MLAAILKRVVFDIIILPSLAILLLITFLDAKAVYRSSLLITELLPGSSLPLLDVLHDSPIHQTLELEFDDRVIEADLYIPNDIIIKSAIDLKFKGNYIQISNFLPYDRFQLDEDGQFLWWSGSEDRLPIYFPNKSNYYHLR